MYKSIIDVHKDTPQDVLQEFALRANRAFNNRAGQVKNVSTNPYTFIYQGEEHLFGCLQLGMLALESSSEFLPYIHAWQWIDEDDPDESEDILAEIARPLGKCYG